MEPTYRIAQRLHERRAAKGLETYARHLDANSQGCMIVHALEESADETNYLIAEIHRRKHAIEKLEALAEEMRADKAPRWAFEMEKLSDLLGGPSALKQYDEILGGGTVAENATVDPRDEALRVATEALEYCRKEFWGMSMREATDSWLGHVANQAEDKTKQALDAIRAAGGGR